jgi:hypothetical protein
MAVAFVAVAADVLAVACSVTRGVAAAALVSGIAAPAVTGSAEEVAAPASGCQLGTSRDQIRHVVSVQFDNVHFTRDVPNVPSDLRRQREQWVPLLQRRRLPFGVHDVRVLD